MLLKLLLVDDDALDREAIKRTLRVARVEAAVFEVSTAEAALGRAHEGVDCILLDYYLPGTDGLTVLRRLREDGIDTPVIALTGQGDEQIAVNLMKAGAADYLSKQSLTPDRIERSLRHALAIAAAERERRDLLAREQLARQEAQAANRAKDEFLATLSHELRTPLNAILGWTRLLGTGQLDEETFRRALQTIERNVRLQAKLIDDLLDISRIVTGKFVVERQPVSLSTILTAVVESQRLVASAADVTLTHSVEGAEEPVIGDGTRLQQVITNLLSNAVKFTPRGGRVDVTLRFADHEAILTVRDTGSGIDADFLPHIFERFRQGDASTTRHQSGLGLGLAIAKHLVEVHGGSIAAESAGRGQGSTFFVRLPTAQVVPDADSEARFHNMTLEGVTVLVVDDDADSREMTRELLNRSGAQVIAAASAAEALALARAHVFDVVLTDIAMPGVDGYSLVRELRGLTPDRPLMAAAITACASPEDRDRALAAGFLAHLAKPCEPARLIRSVAMLANMRGAGTTLA